MTDEPSPKTPLTDKLDWLRRAGCDLASLPRYMHQGVADYILFGFPMGGFATAVFSNDLKDAFGRADEVNTAAMRDWVMFVYNEAPAKCQGSRECVREWQEAGGLLHQLSSLADAREDS